MQEGAQPDTWDMMACSRASENGVTSLTVQWRVHDSVVCSVDGRDEAVPRAATSLVAAFRRGLLVRWTVARPAAAGRAAAAICWPCSFTLLCLLSVDQPCSPAAGSSFCIWRAVPGRHWVAESNHHFFIGQFILFFLMRGFDWAETPECGEALQRPLWVLCPTEWPRE
jgi:hypothetical protein